MNKHDTILAAQTRINKKLSLFTNQLENLSTYNVFGNLISALGTTLEAYLPNVKIGDLCKITDPQHGIVDLYAEVVSIKHNTVKLLPFGTIENISQDSKIERLGNEFKIQVSDSLLGKVVNGFGEILGNISPDSVSYGEFNTLTETRSIQSTAPDPFDRPLITDHVITGVKTIDLFNTCGIGQRIGIFAGPGMGKTTLMGMIIRNALVDVVVVALIGERGREVREFIDLELGKEAAHKCVIVVATSDRPAVEQLKSAYVAQTIAEYFRDQGKNVLMFVDSITRFARAGREVGLSSGEPITRGGFPSSVFLSFPKLMERAGITNKGAITAFYTILMESENLSDDPIADEVKSIIDGHIVLSKKLAERGQFPAVDILKSLSRVADRIITPEHLQDARHIRLLISKHDELEFLIRVGEYKKGQDALADESVEKQKQIVTLLKQGRYDKVEFNSSIANLNQLAKSPIA